MRLFKSLRNLLKEGYCNQRLFFFLAILGLVLPNLILFFTERDPLVVSLCNVVLPLGIFWFLMTLSRKPGRMVWILFLFIFFDAFELVLLYLFGESVIAVDMFLNLVTTNSGEVGELLGNILPAIICVIVIYVPILIWGVYSIYHESLSTKFQTLQRKISLAILGVGVILLILCFTTEKEFKLLDDIYPINVTYNVKLAIEREIKVKNYFESSKDYTFNAIDKHDASLKEIYLLVVGETARAENFGIYGYKRNTTPNLDKEKGLVVFRDVLSQSNTTHKSVPLLLSAVSAQDCDSIYYQKGIFTAYKEAGYNTAFFSNQTPNNSFIDFFGKEASKSVFVKKSFIRETNISDDVLLKLVKNELSSNKSNKLFIVLHTYGSHFNYYERYPANTAYFKPDSVVSAKSKYKKTITNAYDNSIRYTDNFLHRLIGLIDNQKTVSAVIFTSDHGEDIYDDDRKLFLHASPIPSVHQLRVPYLIWTSAKYQDMFPEKLRAMKLNTNKPVSSNLVTFHTILDLSGVATKNFKDKYSLSSDKYCSPKRYYLNDHNDALPMNKIGLKEEDENYFKTNNLVYP